MHASPPYADGTSVAQIPHQPKNQPNMAKIKGAITVNTVRCKGCNLCVVACPTDTLALSPEVNDRGYHFAHMANPDNCTGCCSCAWVCPDACIEVYRVKAD